MDKRTIAGVVIALLVLGGLGWYLAVRDTSTPTASGSSATNMTPSTQSSTAPGSTKQSTATASAVSIKNMAFMPVNVSIKKGAVVTWTNNDSVAHTVTETDGQKGPDSSSIAPGTTYTFTFTSTGTYHYHCSIHPSMTGTVTVTEG